VSDHDVANQIRQARQRLNLTQTQLAEKLGVSPRSVCAWEAGTTVPRAAWKILGGLDAEPAGPRIRQARERLKLTQAQLAEKLGVSRASVNSWENDITHPRSTVLIRDVLNIDQSFLPNERPRIADMSNAELSAHLNTLIAQINETTVEIARRLQENR
jgi:transcriptional regulator with XRE-family HTH domain